MAGPRNYPTLFTSVEYLISDSAKVLLAAPGSKKLYNLLSIQPIVLVSAAQVVTITSTSLGNLLKIGASNPVGVQPVIPFGDGVKMAENEQLNVSSTAGPGIYFLIVYQLMSIGG